MKIVSHDSHLILKFQKVNISIILKRAFIHCIDQRQNKLCDVQYIGLKLIFLYCQALFVKEKILRTVEILLLFF